MLIKVMFFTFLGLFLFDNMDFICEIDTWVLNGYSSRDIFPVQGVRWIKIEIVIKHIICLNLKIGTICPWETT